MRRKLIKVCNQLDWNINEYKNDIDLEKFSSADDDLFFNVDKQNCIAEIKEYILNLNANEHAEM